MAKGRRFTSHEGATSTGAGASTKTAGHTTLGLWVEATGLDPGNDTLEVRVEGSANNDHFAPLNRAAPSVDDALFITDSDFVQSDSDSNVYVGYIVLNNIAIEYVRANIMAYTDSDAESGIDVTTYLFTGGWSGEGKSYNARNDTPVRR